jgi:hypothetical protein
MAEAKTKPTTASVADFIAAQADAVRRSDCEQLLKIMAAASGEPAVMWGSSIIGFGSYAYRYASGKSGDWPLIAFSPRKGELALYIQPGLEHYAGMLARLGKHKAGASCLSIKKLADVDIKVLEELIASSVAQMAHRRTSPGDKTVAK